MEEQRISTSLATYALRQVSHPGALQAALQPTNRASDRVVRLSRALPDILKQVLVANETIGPATQAIEQAKWDRGTQTAR